jgi:hypothetical protein
LRRPFFGSVCLKEFELSNYCDCWAYRRETKTVLIDIGAGAPMDSERNGVSQAPERQSTFADQILLKSIPRSYFLARSALYVFSAGRNWTEQAEEFCGQLHLHKSALYD